MSSCPRRYASKSIRSLTHVNLRVPTPEPLWFLYPSWFRPDSSHQYHTERDRGRERRCTRETRAIASRIAVAVPGSKHANYRCYHATRTLCDQNMSRTADTAPSDPHVTSEAELEVERTVLQEQKIVRRTVSSSKWIPRKEHIPEQRVLERRARYIRNVNPKMLLTLLRSFPPKPDPSSKGVLRVLLPKGARNELVPDFVKNNIWRHYDGTSCLVRYEEDYVELYGTARAQEVAQKYFSDARHFTRSQEHLEWFRKAAHGSYLPIADLSRPPTWTVRSLIDYVTFVTRPRFRRSAQRQVYEDGDSHHRTVSRILFDVFSDPQSRRFASTAALHLAMSYCRKHTEVSKAANDIWSAFLETGLSPDVDCFNQELGRCLVGKDFNRLCQRVVEMKHLNVQPNSTTWALVMAYTERHSARALVLELARDADLLEPDSRASIVTAIAKKEISKYEGTRDGVQRFMAWMENQFGADWLTSCVLERLLRAGRVDKARIGLTSELLLALRKAGKGALIDHKCVMELIQISRKAGDFYEALKLVKHKALSPIADIPQVTIEVLFLMAWDKRYFNVCRFFWFLGATSGRITFKMQRLVSSSLRRNITRIEDPVEASWQLLAGKLIMGTNLVVEGLSEMFPTLSKMKTTSSSATEWLLDWLPDGQSRNEQIHLSQLLVERDLHAYRFYERLRRSEFLKLLDEALALDEAWKTSKAAITLTPRDLMGRSLKIPLKERKMSLPYSGHRGEADGAWFVVGDHKLDYNTLQYNGEATRRLPKELGKNADDSAIQTQDRSPDSVSQTRTAPARKETIIESGEERVVAWQGFG